MIQGFINQARALGASDLHLAGGCYPMARIKGELCLLNGKPLQNLYMNSCEEGLIAEEQSEYGIALSSINMEEIVKQTASQAQLHSLQNCGEIDFSLDDKSKGRCRVNIYKQNSDYALAVRLINEKIPSCQELGIPIAVQNLLKNKQGLILITGSTGAGKSTTMNIITGFLSSTSGTVKVNGHDILEEPELAKKEIGYLPENPPLYTDMTVREYLNFVSELKGVPKSKRNHQD